LCKKRRKVWFFWKLHCRENWLRLVSHIFMPLFCSSDFLFILQTYLDP
jgi:hypothetical protein